jgi:hypothetical protein
MRALSGAKKTPRRYTNARGVGCNWEFVMQSRAIADWSADGICAGSLNDS